MNDEEFLRKTPDLVAQIVKPIEESIEQLITERDALAMRVKDLTAENQQLKAQVEELTAKRPVAEG